MRRSFWILLGVVIFTVVISNLAVVFIASSNGRQYTTIGVPGSPGRDGESVVGSQGEPGHDGRDGANGQNGLPGANGVDGANGEDGKDGRNGIDGKDGIGGLPGANGRTPELKCFVENNQSVIKWRYIDEEAWRNLVTLNNAECNEEITQVGD